MCVTHAIYVFVSISKGLCNGSGYFSLGFAANQIRDREEIAVSKVGYCSEFLQLTLVELPYCQWVSPCVSY